MGELAEDFAALKEYKLEVRSKIEPGRIDYAKKHIEDLGFITTWDDGNKCLVFSIKTGRVKMYPFTGWFTGRGLGDGRGIHTLVKRLGELN